ncbi:MAG: hypothetical protein JXR68_04725, partial [Bacteroidales bacterium]|nr:hypothetical protein [Bacteroidales bacterium]
ADSLFEEEQYEKAIEKYKEAQEFDKNADLNFKIQNCLNEITKIEEQKRKDEEIKQTQDFLKQKEEKELKRQEENRIKREEEKKELLNEGLNIPHSLDDFNKGKKIVETFYKAKEQKLIVNENAEVLKGFILKCISKNNKRWKKFPKQDWVLVKKWVGDEKAQNWYMEINEKK